MRRGQAQNLCKEGLGRMGAPVVTELAQGVAQRSRGGTCVVGALNFIRVHFSRRGNREA